MIIEVKGVQFVNKGAELMLLAVVENLRRTKSKIVIALTPSRNSPYLKRCEHLALQKVSLRKGRFDFNFLSYWLPKGGRRWLMDSLGIVLEADIDMVLDASGFAYGDQWRNDSVRYLCSEILRFKKNDKPYIFLPQAFGPFSDKADVKRLNKCFGSAAHVFVRDEASLQFVKAVIDSPNVELFPDFTNLLNPSKGLGFIDSQYSLVIPNGQMLSSRNLSNSQWLGNYIRVLGKFIEVSLEKGYLPVVLNHEGKIDDEICSALIESYGDRISYLELDNALDVKRAIRDSAIVFSSRFHGCVSALTQKVPCLCTSWSHKYELLFKDYNKDKFVVSHNVSHSDMVELFQAAMQEKSNEAYLARCEYDKDKSLQMWSKVHAVIEHYSENRVENQVS
ncbi:polysaccharide pyruvyl transferase family protein [Pseudomaricurvus alcaniphilus]|uniref:polysaccharide pyruvyl transferase family protein n=1 Tax=Pseudomaricurvus alcaniphilus TaxID=1166482 RepID=UPI0014099391|nr:polysaccharide pyruvyl transferase family protein [Pseudomaricurvus alcaniphilus]